MAIAPYDHIIDQTGRCPCVPEIYEEFESVTELTPFGFHSYPKLNVYIVHGEEVHMPRRYSGLNRRPRIANPVAMDTLSWDGDKRPGIRKINLNDLSR